ADAGGVGGRIPGLDLEVLGRVGVDHTEPGVDVVHQDDRRLRALERLAHAVRVECDGVAGRDLAVDGVGEPGRIRDEDAGRLRVVFGLADEVVGHVDGVGGGVGQHGDLGGPRLGVDPHHAAAQSFGGGDEDVTGAGDHVHGLEAGAGGLVPVGQERDGLGAAHGPDLVDLQECA